MTDTSTLLLLLFFFFVLYDNANGTKVISLDHRSPLSGTNGAILHDLIAKRFESVFKSPTVDVLNKVMGNALESRSPNKILEIDPEYLSQLQHDLSNVGKFKPTPSNNNINQSIFERKNGTESFLRNTGLNVKGYKKSWKKSARIKQLQYQLNTNHISSSASINNNDVYISIPDKDLSFDVEGLIAESLMTQALHISQLRNGSKSAYNTVHSSTASYSSIIRALLISANRAKDQMLLFNSDLKRSQFMLLIKHCEHTHDLKSAALLLAFKLHTHNDDDNTTEMVSNLLMIAVLRRQYINAGLLFSVVRNSSIIMKNRQHAGMIQQLGIIATLRSLLQIQNQQNENSYEIDSCVDVLLQLQAYVPQSIMHNNKANTNRLMLLQYFERELVTTLKSYQHSEEHSSGKNHKFSFPAELLESLYLSVAVDDDRSFLLTATTILKGDVLVSEKDWNVIQEYMPSTAAIIPH